MRTIKLSLLFGAMLLACAARAESVVFTSITTIGCTNTTYEGYDVTVSACTLIVACEHSFHSLTLVSGGVVTHASEDTGGVHLNIATSMRVNTGCEITANDKGWSAGPGAGGACIACRLGYLEEVCVAWDHDEWGNEYCVSWDWQCLQWGSVGSGGGHGGEGGDAGYCWFEGVWIPGGSTYGSVTQPTELGSGGGFYEYGLGGGGAGGGAIRINAADTILVNGSIMANGRPGWGWPDPAGGGSGGSIYLVCGILSGNGTVTADGGYSADYEPGGGGGGRIALYYCSRTLPEYNVNARGGSERGGFGTVHIAPPESPDCNSNGNPDLCDIFVGTSLDGNENGIPDECESVVPPVLVVQFTEDSRLMLIWTAVAGFSEYIVYGQHAEEAAVPLDTVNVLEFDATGLLSGPAPQRWLFHVVGTRE